jgi:hypothetical protein
MSKKAATNAKEIKPEKIIEKRNLWFLFRNEIITTIIKRRATTKETR